MVFYGKQHCNSNGNGTARERLGNCRRTIRKKLVTMRERLGTERQR